jgi:hypothetical protein
MADEFPPDHAFTAADANALGVTPSEFRRHLEAGVVTQLLHGAYVPGWWADTPDNRARAAARVLPGHCVLADRSAASLHGIDVFDFAELDVLPDLEVVAVEAANPTRRRGVLGGKRDLRPDEIMTVGDVRVTTPIRTACDIACLRGRRRALGTLDAFRATYGLTEAALTAMLPRYAARRGVTQLRELIPLSRDGVDSQPESWIRIDIHDEGYPMPAAQVWVWLPGWGRVKVENAWEHLRLAVEYDGEENHSSDEDRSHDEARREALRKAGWIIIVVRREGLTADGRAVWLAELAAAYDDRVPYPAAKRIYARSPDRRPRVRGRR